jgi:hypothetical protein
MLADGPVPFVLDGWRAVAGDEPYEGFLVSPTGTIEASDNGEYSSRIRRPADEN